ncbi:MAG: hypothetical protein J7513_11340, partial [Solirubrobacteraceae bacterium]|nr:hypothetical protein [Solirubrobacteraceae bacterium]
PTPSPTPDPLPGGSVRLETAWRNSSSVIEKQSTVVSPGDTTPLDVDGDSQPDFDAVVSLGSGDVSLDVEPTGASAPPAEVVAVVSDPQHHVLGRDGVRFGFDATDATSPDNFSATAGAGDSFDLTVDQDAPAAAVATAFDGTDAARVDPVDVRLAAPPESAEFGLDFSHAGTAADPQRLAFTGRDGSSQPAGVGEISFTADGGAPALGRGTVAAGTLDGVPSDLVLRVSHEGDATTLDAATPGGAPASIDSAKIGAAASAAAIRYPQIAIDPVDGLYLRDTTGDPFVLGVRASNLTHLEAAFGRTTRLDADTADGMIMVDGATDAATGTLTTGTASLPSLDLTADLDAGSLHAAGGAPLADVDLVYTLADAGVLGASTVKLAASGVGVDTTLTFDGDPRATTGLITGAELTSDASVNLRLALASAGETATLPAADVTNTLDLAATGTATTLTARVNGLRSLHVNPQSGTFSGTLTSSRPTTVNATVQTLAGDGTATGEDSKLNTSVTNAPTSFSLSVAPRAAANGGGAQLAWTGTTTTSQVTVAFSGPDLIDGVGELSADVRGVPQSFASVLQEPGSGTAVFSTTVSGGASIDELRLAAGIGTLPATGAASDKLAYIDGTEPEISVKLTGLKGASFAPSPTALTLDNVEALTKPVALSAKVPNTTGPDMTLSGTLNKPSFHTEVSAVPAGAAPAKLSFAVTNGSTATPRTMSSLSLSFTNASSSPSAAVSLTNVPRSFTGCVADGGSCVSTAVADLPAAVLSTWTGPNACSPQPQVPGNVNRRPYSPGTSFAFDDDGSSGTSNNINQMVTINASMAGASGAFTINNLRVHTLRGDVADSGTTFTFKPIVSISAGEVPRMYAWMDSESTPFVVNDLRTPAMPKLVMGTDSAPARARKRLAWVPGAVRSSILGCSVGQNISTQAQNALDCGGAKEMQLGTSIGTLNMFNLPLFGDVLGICGGTV